MGQVMLFNREAIEAIGGLQSAEGQLVDDMYIGQRLVQAGYHNIIIKHTLPVVAEGLSVGDFLKVYCRWLLFARNGLDLAFVWPMIWRGVAFFLALGTVAAGFVWGGWWAALFALLGQCASAEMLQRQLGGTPTPRRYFWVYAALLLIAPLIVASLAWSRVDWRGREYRLGAQASLAATSARRVERFARRAKAVESALVSALDVRRVSKRFSWSFSANRFRKSVDRNSSSRSYTET
jgi:hypothetical protein